MAPTSSSSGSSSASHIQDGVQVMVEVDFLARVEAAERRDNRGNSSGEAELKYAITPVTVQSVNDTKDNPQPSQRGGTKKKLQHVQRTSPTREHRIHDETGSAKALQLKALKRKGNAGSGGAGQLSGRPGRAGNPKVTPRMQHAVGAGARGGAGPLMVGGRSMTTPRPPSCSLGISAAGGRLTHNLGGGGGFSAALPTSARLPPRMAAAAPASLRLAAAPGPLRMAMAPTAAPPRMAPAPTAAPPRMAMAPAAAAPTAAG